VGQGRLLADLTPGDDVSNEHLMPVYTLAFSQENSVLAVGGADNRVTVNYLQSALAGESADSTGSK